ncbi:MAG: AMP-binding protein, partial [Pseudomonadota bacterium]
MTAVDRYAALRSLPHALTETVARAPNVTALSAKRDGDWRSWTYRALQDEAWRFAARLRASGVAPGDRVLLAAENRPEWAIADAAIMAAGAITVPAYATNTADDHRHVLNDSGASAAVISTPALAKRFQPAFDDADACKTLFTMDPAAGAETMADANAAGGDADIDATVAGLTRGDMACIIYTS